MSARLDRFEAFFSAMLRRGVEPGVLCAAMEYAALSGGKRVRPYVILLLGAELGVARQKLLPVAAAVEMVHAYSLTHDDLPAMDDDDLRRGRPTLHRRFDEATAILAGDALLSEAFAVLAETEMVSEAQRVLLVRTLARASGGLGMVAGQMRDLAAEGQSGITVSQIAAIHALKTGAIFGFCVESAAILAECSAQRQEALRTFAKHLGALFQLSDDILGRIGDYTVSGKSAESDSRNRKATLPEILGLGAARQASQRLMEDALLALQEAGLHSSELEGFVRWLAVRER